MLPKIPCPKIYFPIYISLYIYDIYTVSFGTNLLAFSSIILILLVLMSNFIKISHTFTSINNIFLDQVSKVKNVIRILIDRTPQILSVEGDFENLALRVCPPSPYREKPGESVGTPLSRSQGWDNWKMNLHGP